MMQFYSIKLFIILLNVLGPSTPIDSGWLTISKYTIKSVKYMKQNIIALTENSHKSENIPGRQKCLEIL